jgi:putative membrane protein
MLPVKEKNIIGAFVAFFLVGIILHLVPALSFIPRNITDVFLFTANAIVFVQVLRMNNRSRFALFFLAAWLFTYLAEVAGVNTGRVFGAYQYGDALKLQVLEVPLIIPFNWVMLVLGMTSIMRSLRIPSWMVPLLAATGLVIFDFVMEPVAIALDYWTWQDSDIPAQNYLAWFLIAFLVSAAAWMLKFGLDKKLLRYYVVIQLVFFLVLNVFFRFSGA